MRLSIIVCCLLIMMTGCKSSKNIKYNEQTNYSSELNELRSSLDSLHINVSRQTQITAERLSNLKVENKTIYLSKPDSTGKQHPIKQSITHIHQENKENIKQYENLLTTLDKLSSRIDSLYNVMELIQDKKEEIKELNWWDLHKNKVLFVLIAIFIVFLIVKNNLYFKA